MKKRDLKRIFASLAITSVILSGCAGGNEGSGNKEKQQEEKKETETKKEEEVNYGKSYQDAVAELDKAKADKKVDFDKVTSIYKDDLQSLVQKRDGENDTKSDEQISAALEAGKDGSMDSVVVRQVFDKLMQKAFYTTVKHEFTEVEENWKDKKEVKKEIEEAKEFYSIIKPTVEKRDAAYKTDMISVIDGGFAEIDKAAAEDKQLDFMLGKQMVDKTLMKTFYLATGALPEGYATKASKVAKENPEEAKIEQAEGWAFYQSLFSYLNGHAPKEAAFIEDQFNLENDAANLDPDAVNKAFVRGYAKIALDEYKESQEMWGEDKSAVTALEGALFIDIVGKDLERILGEQDYKTLTENAQKYLEAAKSKDKKAGEPLMKEINKTLNDVIVKAK